MNFVLVIAAYMVANNVISVLNIFKWFKEMTPQRQLIIAFILAPTLVGLIMRFMAALPGITEADINIAYFTAGITLLQPYLVHWIDDHILKDADKRILEADGFTYKQGILGTIFKYIPLILGIACGPLAATASRIPYVGNIMGFMHKAAVTGGRFYHMLDATRFLIPGGQATGSKKANFAGV